MPHEVVLGSIYTTVKGLLAGSAPLTALLAAKPVGSGAGIYDEGGVPQAATMPYVTVGAGTQVPWHTIGMAEMPRYGWNCTIQVKAVGQGSEAAGFAIMSQVAAVLYDGRELNLAGYAFSWCAEFTLQPTIVESVAGVITRSWPAIVRVWCHD